MDGVGLLAGGNSAGSDVGNRPMNTSSSNPGEPFAKASTPPYDILSLLLSSVTFGSHLYLTRDCLKSDVLT